MNVSYLGPLQQAWARTRRLLFKPFDIPTWLIIGFAAFLSELCTGAGGFQTGHGGHGGGISGRALHGINGLLSGVLLTGIGIVILCAVLVLVLVLTWVNSRGRFIFLDNVALERAAFVEPWKRYARLGNSLFVWMLAFVLVCGVLAVLILLPFVATLAALTAGGGFHWEAIGALGALFSVFAPFVLLASYVLLLLSHFVVPLMYRHGIGVLEAWGRFLALFRAHVGTFVLYGIYVFMLNIVVIVALALIGFASCCVGFVLFSFPYVSSVILLPILVTFRGLGPEFLAQFGPDYTVFAAAPAEAAPGPTGEAPPTPPPAPGGGAAQ